MESYLKEKKNEDIGKLFDDISHQYDFLNHFLSFGVDRHWRKKMIRMIRNEGAVNILDVATGTADLAIYASLYVPGSHITGIDISEKMLEVGREKISRLKLGKHIRLVQIPAEKLTFDEHVFDVAMVAFGVRNFESLESGLKEMLRVIKPGGKVFILEFSKPKGPFGFIYRFYFRYILPSLGRMVSKNKDAYTYLHDSVAGFPQGSEFLNIMEENGFIDTQQKRLSGGIASIYIGQKQKNT